MPSTQSVEEKLRLAKWHAIQSEKRYDEAIAMLANAGKQNEQDSEEEQEPIDPSQIALDFDANND